MRDGFQYTCCVLPEIIYGSTPVLRATNNDCPFILQTETLQIMVLSHVDDNENMQYHLQQETSAERIKEDARRLRKSVWP